jgi:hypothetical protein
MPNFGAPQAATEVQRTCVHRRGFCRQQLGQDILGADGPNCQWIGKTMGKPGKNHRNMVIYMENHHF